MNEKRVKWLLFAIFSGTIMVSAAAWTMGPGAGRGHDPAVMIAHMAARLDLSDEQRDEVEAIVASSRQASAADHQRLQELRQLMKGQTENFDSGKAQQIADEIGLISGRMAYQFTSTHAQIYQLLSEQQRAEMAGFMEKRESRRGKWHKGDRREGAPTD